MASRISPGSNDALVSLLEERALAAERALEHSRDVIREELRARRASPKAPPAEDVRSTRHPLQSTSVSAIHTSELQDRAELIEERDLLMQVSCARFPTAMLAQKPRRVSIPCMLLAGGHCVDPIS